MSLTSLSLTNYIIPSDNWEQQLGLFNIINLVHYIIPSDNWEQQLPVAVGILRYNYIIPSDNWEQQRHQVHNYSGKIISYQAITGNNNF